MGMVKEIFEERKKYFENLDIYLKEILNLVRSILPSARIYLFGSVVKGNYAIGLSDIDIAIVSEEFENKEKKLEILDILLQRFFDSPFEFHLLSEKQWNYYLKFIGKDYKEVK